MLLIREVNIQKVRRSILIPHLDQCCSQYSGQWCFHSHIPLPGATRLWYHTIRLSCWHHRWMLHFCDDEGKLPLHWQTAQRFPSDLGSALVMIEIGQYSILDWISWSIRIVTSWAGCCSPSFSNHLFLSKDFICWPCTSFHLWEALKPIKIWMNFPCSVQTISTLSE